MNQELKRLLDNGWIVTVLRSVDRRYCATARRKDQSTKDVFGEFGVAFGSDGEPQLVRKSQGIPSQRADGDEPDEALASLAAKVFGLGEPTKE